jgi:transposase-like protein
MAETRRKFDQDFREGAVRLVRETGRPIAEVARDLGINPGTLGNWVNADRRRRGDGTEPGEDERAELARLRKENAELAMERDVLKRSVALWTLCRYRHNQHVLRELVAVTETGTDLDRAWAQQAIDALLALDKAAEAARAAGKNAIGPEVLAEHEDWYRKAAATGITLNAGRGSKLRQKRHALATRLQAREDDYLRFARDLRIPFTNNPAEQVIRMSKLRIKVSGCMRSMKGAETFCAIRSYLATAARHGITWLDALTRAAEGNPWIPGTT